MSNSVEEFIYLIFERKWRCEGTRISLSTLYDFPKVEDLIPEPPCNFGYPLLNRGVRVEIIENDPQHSLDLLNNISRAYVGDEYYKAVNATPIEAADLTINDIATIMQNNGCISLICPEDSVEIYTVISKYLKHINDSKMFNVHYIPPPEEDIKTLTKLKDILTQVASPFYETGKGNSDYSKIMNLMSVNLGGNRNVTPKVILNGLYNTSRLAVHEKGKDPYEFRSR